MQTITPEQAAAAKLLELAGWVVIPPYISNKIPDFAVGQIWKSPFNKSSVRQIVHIGPSSYWPLTPNCVYYVIPGECPDRGERVLRPHTFKSWIERRQAVLVFSTP